MSFVNLLLNPFFAMSKQSAGVLLYRFNAALLEVFLVHPGGPYYLKKDEGAWSIPKGEFIESELALDAAKREFREETGFEVMGDFTALQPVVLKSGKKIYAWALEGDLDEGTILSNLFEMEWPPRSGKKQYFPEIDRGEWFDIEMAKVKINEAQVGLLEQLAGLHHRI